MKQNDKLKNLKLLAKRYARATGQPQHAALDLVARRLDFPHWNALTGSAKGEWAPSEAQVATIKAFVERITSYEGSTVTIRRRPRLCGFDDQTALPVPGKEFRQA